MIISGLAMTAVTPRQVFAAPQGCGVTGEAFAINANVLGLNLAKIAGVTLPPGGSNTTAPLNVNVGLTSLGLNVLPSTSNDTSTQSQASALSTAGMGNLGLTNGVTLPIVGTFSVLDISADAIAVSANSVSTGSGGPTNSGTATVANLKIAGQTLNGAVTPNTKLDLTVSVARVGVLTVAKVTLNEQITNQDGGITVNGAHIQVLSVPLLSLAAGDIIIASATAKAGCSGPVPSPSATPSPTPQACVTGEAFGVQASVLNVVSVPTTPSVTLPMAGCRICSRSR
jgi:hypothetical protein